MTKKLKRNIGGGDMTDEKPNMNAECAAILFYAIVIVTVSIIGIYLWG